MESNWSIWKTDDTRKDPVYMIVNNREVVIFTGTKDSKVQSLKIVFSKHCLATQGTKIIKVKNISEHSIKMLQAIKPNATIQDLLKI